MNIYWLNWGVTISPWTFPRAAPRVDRIVTLFCWLSSREGWIQKYSLVVIYFLTACKRLYYILNWNWLCIGGGCVGSAGRRTKWAQVPPHTFPTERRPHQTRPEHIALYWQIHLVSSINVSFQVVTRLILETVWLLMASRRNFTKWIRRWKNHELGVSCIYLHWFIFLIRATASWSSFCWIFFFVVDSLVSSCSPGGGFE